MGFEHLFDINENKLTDHLLKMGFSQRMLAGKRVLVSGGARGIAKRSIEGLAWLGAEIVFIDQLKEGEELVDLLAQRGCNARFYHFDISDQEELDRWCEYELPRIGHIDILLNNAVDFHILSVLESTMEDWDRTLDTNLRASVRLIKSVMPGMIERNEGVVMNMVALEGMAYAASMSASKVALRSLTISLSAEVQSDQGVSVMGFAPGLTATPLVKEVFPAYCERMGFDFEDYVLNICNNPGYKGMMPIDDVASALIYHLVHAQDYRGMVASPFNTLEQFGIIEIEERRAPKTNDNIFVLRKYIDDILSLNRNIESNIQTRTKDLEEEKERTQRLNTILEKAQELGEMGSFVFDVRTQEMEWSEYVRQIFELNPDEAPPSMSEYREKWVHPDDKEGWKEKIRGNMISGRKFSFSYRIITARKNVKHVMAFGEGVFDEQGNLLKIMGLLQDATEKMKMEELKQEQIVTQKSLRFKSEFLAQMSHEIRTPLNGIMGMVDVLLRNTSLDQKQESYIETIRESSEDLMQMVNDVLDLSKVEAGRMSIHPISFDLSASMQRTIDLFRSKALENQVELILEMRDDVPHNVFADRQRITQVLNNLIHNAIKFTRNGTVKLLVEKLGTNGDLVQIGFRVIDSGVGISKFDLEKLFSKYYQTKSAQMRNLESGENTGTGLGLSICQGLVNLMGGEISCESELKKGSTFSFELEVPLGKLEDEANRKEELSQNLGMSIMVVEDKVVNQQVVSLMLESMGCQVEIAENGEECLLKYPKGKFDLILMDIQMPVMDGITATAELRRNYSELPPIIALSANNMEGDKERYLSLGLDGYLSKPIQYEVLLETLLNVRISQDKQKLKLD